MSTDDSPPNDPYDEEYGAHDDSAYEGGDTSRFPFPAVSWGWPPAFFRESERDGNREDEVGVSGREDGGWLDEGVSSLVLIVGVALFLFPEPATSFVGIALVVIGVVAWLIDAVTFR